MTDLFRQSTFNRARFKITQSWARLLEAKEFLHSARSYTAISTDVSIAHKLDLTNTVEETITIIDDLLDSLAELGNNYSKAERGEEYMNNE